ncbi:MAG: lysophospholipid acyltransferase family protein [Burkholderiales bacterium]
MARWVMRMLAGVPLPALHAFGAFFGWLIYVLSPTYRRHLRENLAQAGYADAALRRAVIASTGRMIAELPAIWMRPRKEVLRLVKSFDPQGLIAAARAAGRAIVFLTPHQGCFEVVAQAIAEQVPITIMYRPPKLGFLGPLTVEGRGKRNVRLATADLSGVREMLAALRRGETIGILPDQVPGAGEGEWAEFFGRPAYTMTLAMKLARRPGTVVLMMFGERLPRGEGYAIHAKPMPEALPGESDMRLLNRALEAQLRDCPSQYLWGYNRYKRPRGAPAQERSA